ncbi:MAG: YdcF family protein [Acidobacteria bacterium]|nr:YdcF family protein [Acidobacteriota bacterium]MBU4331368.1 YdcF family protein [Acidobacteriota bacterium]
MFFYLKKILQALFLPHTLIFILLVVSLILIFRKKRLGRLLLLLTIVFFYAVSIRPVADGLMGGLERSQTIVRAIPAGVNTVVVLSGGLRNEGADLPASSLLGSSSLSRLLEGIRLLRQMDAGRLILSGGEWRGRRLQRASAAVMREMAVELGISVNRIILEDRSRDTHEQAAALKSYLGEDPFFLVTSAFHMKRSLHLFMENGMSPLPAPADFRGRQEKRYDLFDWLPAPHSLYDALLAVKEYGGLLFYRVF